MGFKKSDGFPSVSTDLTILCKEVTTFNEDVDVKGGKRKVGSMGLIKRLW